ncbi:MAG: pyridoxamine 5'-phosphate oxidase family protein [Elusimicrobiota bacterium]
MNFNDCIKFAKEHPLCYLATMDGDQPHVRGFLLWYADETGFYFHTADSKSVFKQLKVNPRLEVCFFVPERYPDLGIMLRVAGKVKFIEDTQVKVRLLEERPFLQEMAGGPDDPKLSVFQIHTGSAYFWRIENNLKESEVEKIKF